MRTLITIIGLLLINTICAQHISIPNTKIELKDSTYSYYVNQINRKKKNSRLIFSSSMLNSWFKGELSSLFTNTKDFSFDNYFIITDTDAKTLTIGASKNIEDVLGFNTKESKRLNRLRHVGAIYFRSSFSDGFSKLRSKNNDTDKFEFNSGIGIGIKYTYLGRGTIRFNKSAGKKFELLRDLIIKSKISNDIDKYNKGEFLEAFEKEVLDVKLNYLIDNGIDFYDDNFDIKTFNFPEALIDEKKIEANIIKIKYFALYDTIIEKEVELLKKNKLFNAYRTNWTTVEAYYPLTSQNFKTSPDEATDFSSNEFKDWRVALGINFIRVNKYDNILKLSLISSVYNNNNFLAQNESAKTFQSISTTTPNYQVLGLNNKVFVGEYDKFTTTSLKAEIGYLYHNTFGVSGAIERTFDKFDVTNWKLAIPFSLKDKEDKPTVNFELQWKETYKEHVIGIGVGYIFGRYMK